VQQHLPTVYRWNPKAFGRFHKCRRGGAIHQVHYGTCPCEALEIEWEFVFTAEPEAGRVHNQVEVAVIDIGATFRHAYAIASDSARHRSSPLNRAIEN
jgi:hypothetical protein